MANKKVKGYISLGGSFSTAKCMNYNTSNEPFSVIDENEAKPKILKVKEKEFYTELEALANTLGRLKKNELEKAKFVLELYEDIWTTAKKYYIYLAKNNATDARFLDAYISVLNNVPVKKTKFHYVYPLGF
jgi:hypothetical protein